MEKLKKYRWAVAAAAAFLLLALSVIGFVTTLDAKPEDISTDKAISLIDSGKIKDAEVREGTILNGTGALTLTDADGKKYAATYPSTLGSSVNQKLIDKGVHVQTKMPDNNALTGLIGQVAPMLVAGVLIVYMVRKQSGGKFDSQITGGDVPDVTFDDIAGAEEAKHDIKEIIEFLTDGKRFTDMGAKPPKGALLVGPPGTGKTLLAKAAAGESKLPFFSLSGSDFVEIFAGVGPRRVRKLFKAARKHGGIIFIDEIDAIGQKRGSLGSGGDTQERENIIAALLTEMDGFEGREGVLVLAATNRPETLDEALLRPGRLDRQIQVPLPDIKGRKAILEVHTKDKKIDGSVNLDVIAQHTAGMSGAELAFTVNEAAMNAVRRGHESVLLTDVLDAVNTVALGRSRDSAFMTDKDKELTAFHEAGHAAVALVASMKSQVSVRPNFVTIIPRGGAGGLTRMDNEESNYMRKSTARDFLAISMGGRAAEMLKYGVDHYTSGASGDLHSSTNLATQMVLKYGMSDDGALISVDDRSIQMSQGRYEPMIQKELTAALIRAREILDTKYGRTLLEAIAKELLEKETLHVDDIARIESYVNAGDVFGADELVSGGGEEGKGLAPEELTLFS